MAENQAALVKVRIFGNNGESMLFGEPPYGRVISLEEALGFDMDGLGKQVKNPPDDSIR